MTIRLRLVAIIVLVALVPLAVSAWITLGMHQRALDRNVRELQTRTGEHAAALAGDTLDDAIDRISRLAVSVPWDQLSAGELDAAPWLIYRQVADVAAVVLLDADGRALGAGAALAVGEPSGDLGVRRRWTAEGGDALVAAASSGRGVAVWSGAPMRVPGPGGAVVPIAIPMPASAAVRTVVVALALDGICRVVDDASTSLLDAILVDADGRMLCGPEDAALLPAPRRSDQMRTRAATRQGWMVLVDQDTAAALAPSRAIRRQTLYWLAIGFAAALLAGLFLARRIVRPIDELARGADELARGNVGYRLDVAAGGGDELAQLGRAFNHMGEEIQERDVALQAWNERLQQLVDERTRELAEAQELLVRSQRIAAVGSLGAGFAHEINNPLTGLLGMTQVLHARAVDQPGRERDATLLAAMEQEALRIRDVVATLKRLTEEFGTEGGLAPLDVNRVVDDTVALVARRASSRAVTLVRTPARELPPVLGVADELQQALLHLVDNALQAMDGTGRLSVSTGLVDDHLVEVVVADTGSGIAPDHLSKIFDPFFTTKQNWRAPGLGLTTAFRIVERHHGKIKVNSVIDQGTTMTITLPAARREAHLS